MADDATDPLEQATAPVRWLLDAGVAGVPLTAMYELEHAVVREAVERWPGWWDAELFGPPHREADVAVLRNLHQGVRRLKLMRWRGRRLFVTPRGRQLAADPAALAQVLLADLGAGDPFTVMVASVVTARLAAAPAVPCEHDDLVAPALQKARRRGWHGSRGQPPGELDVASVVSDVLRRGEAYGLVQRHPDLVRGRFGSPQITLTAGARVAMGLDRPTGGAGAVIVFDAELTGVRGVRARLAVRAVQPLTALHEAIREAFGWDDDHPYAFWLGTTFPGDASARYGSPAAADQARPTAKVPLAELDLAVGATIAYVPGGDDRRRVYLTVREQTGADDGPYPRVLERPRAAPPRPPDDEGH